MPHDELFADQIDRIEKKLDTIGVILTGNGHPENGLVLQVDRLKQDNNRTKWYVRTFAAAFIGVAVTALAHFAFGVP